jgi:hypothetical protein
VQNDERHDRDGEQCDRRQHQAMSEIGQHSPVPPSRSGLARPSTTLPRIKGKDVDGRHKAGHDGIAIMP